MKQAPTLGRSGVGFLLLKSGGFLQPAALFFVYRNEIFA